MAWTADYLTRQRPWIYCVDWHRKKKWEARLSVSIYETNIFVILFSHKSLNGAKECCCCMFTCTTISLVSQNIGSRTLPYVSLSAYVVWISSLRTGGITIQRLSVVLVEVVSKHDCKSSDLMNSNQNVTITLWGGPLRRLPGLAKVKRAQFICWWMSSMSLDVPVLSRFKIWGCDIQWGYFGYILIALL